MLLAHYMAACYSPHMSAVQCHNNFLHLVLTVDAPGDNSAGAASSSSSCSGRQHGSRDGTYHGSTGARSPNLPRAPAHGTSAARDGWSGRVTDGLAE